MRNQRRLRRLTIGDTTWLWSVRHSCNECREVLSLHRQGVDATLRIVFRAGPGRFVADYFRHDGSIGDGDDTFNLHEPGVVRRFLDAAAARDALPASRGEKEIDGWPIFDALVTRDRSPR